MTNQDFTFHKGKEKKLHIAIDKVTAKLQEYSNRNSKIIGRQWTPEEEQYFKDWNNLHDLLDRLESRLKSNWIDWTHKQFVQNGFSIIEL